ncbi:MAG: hypothetical protein ACSHX0_01385 [Akkermansiaceae bacterium]
MPTTEQDAESLDPQVDSQKPASRVVGKFSPFAGCLIFIVLALVVTGVITYTWMSYKQVQATIVGMTEETPQVIEIDEAKGQEASLAHLSIKLNDFKNAINTQTLSSLTLSKSELNLAIANYALLEPNRGKLRVHSISNEAIAAEVSYPVKSGFRSEKKLYLNGMAQIVPEIKEGALFPSVTSVLTPAGVEVPAEFRKFISESMLHPLRNDEEIGRIFQNVSDVKTSDGSVTLYIDPSYIAPGTLPDDTSPITNRFMKGFALIAVVFLLIVAVIIFLSRKKSQNTN